MYVTSPDEYNILWKEAMGVTALELGFSSNLNQTAKSELFDLSPAVRMMRR
jgi:hypothetical protein